MTETDQTLEPAETTHVGTPAPEAATDSSSEVAEQKDVHVETTTDAEAEPAQSWDGFSLNAPENADAEQVAAFAEAVKAQGLTPDAAQKMLDQIAPVIAARQMAALDAVHRGWIEASKADKEIGGAKFEENMAIAKKAAEAYGDDELHTLLKPISEGGQGLGNHPAINRLLVRAGKGLQPITSVVDGQPPVAKADGAKVLYANSNMK